MPEEIVHALTHALTDSLKLLPFLFLVYFFIELTEEKLSASHKLLRGNGAPALGALLGCIPQCGFSVMITSLYVRRLVSVGTVLAVFLSTSDEAIPIILAHPDRWADIVKLLAVKLIVALIAGYAVDLFLGAKLPQPCCKKDEKEEQAHVKGCCSHEIAHQSQRWKELLLHPFLHTLKIGSFLFVTMALLNIALEYIGEEKIASFLLAGSAIQPLAAAVVGLIPTCLPSVLLTELYLAGQLSFGAVVAGLSAGTGMGLLLLLRENRNKVGTWMLMILLYVSAALAGCLLQWMGV
ncbi:MAG: arsenic efflux protein [Clostridia bacterium]|nr:arsenic efflux protein [Clostridia bacterium]